MGAYHEDNLCIRPNAMHFLHHFNVTLIVIVARNIVLGPAVIRAQVDYH